MTRPNALFLAGLALLLGFAVLVRVPFFDVPMITDEGGYAYVAHFWSDQYQLYRDIPFDRPQGIFVIYDAILTFFGTDIGAVRLAAAVYNLATLLVVFAFAQRMFDTRTAWASAILFALFSASPSIEGFTANAELFASLPLTLAALLTWKKQWVWAGFFAGVAFLLKQTGVSGIILAVLWIAVTRETWRGAFKDALRSGLAFSIGPLILIVHAILIGWQHVWASMVERKMATDTLVSRTLLVQVTNLLESMVRTAPAWLLLVVCAALIYTRLSSRTRTFVWLWVLTSIFGMSIGGHWSRHYYIQLIPVLSLLAGAGVVYMLRATERIESYRPVIAAMALFALFDLPLWFVSPDTTSEIVYGRPAYVMNDEIATYVNDNTAEDDTIYVAFYQAEIYYLANRRNAIPQLYGYELAASEAAYRTIVDHIRQREPAMVVWVQPPPADYAAPEDFERVLLYGYREVQQFTEEKMVTGEEMTIRVFARDPLRPCVGLWACAGR